MDLLAAVQDCFNTSVQWLQGPLHCLRDAQCPQRADSDILASYAHKWVGSGQAHPCSAPQQTAEALRWDLASTLTDTAALTAMLLPDTPMAGFRRLLRHPHAHCPCRLPSGTVQSQHSASWTGRAPAVGPVQHPIAAYHCGQHPGTLTTLHRCRAGQSQNLPDQQRCAQDALAKPQHAAAGKLPDRGPPPLGARAV